MATAGVGAGIGGSLGKSANKAFGNYGGQVATGVAAGLAASAAESLVTGRDFGDTITANLPGIIANTIGNMVGESIAGTKGKANPSLAAQDPDAITVTIDHAQLGRGQDDASLLFGDSQSAAILGADAATVANLSRREAIVKVEVGSGDVRAGVPYSGYVDVVDAGNVYSYGMLAAREANLDTFFAANPNSPDRDKAYAAIAHNRDLIAQGNAVADASELDILANFGRQNLKVGAFFSGGVGIAAGLAETGIARYNGEIGDAETMLAITGAARAIAGSARLAKAAESAAPLRPSWRASELDVGARIEGQGYRAQVSFKDGVEVPYGTKGSVRPEYYNPGSSIEVKNYNVETARGRSNLVRNVSDQAVDRARNLPPGTAQNVYIDVRGQNVSRADLNAMISRIVQRSNGAVQPNNINIVR